MCPTVTLTFESGSLRGERRELIGPGPVYLGRGPEGSLDLPLTAEFTIISRRHCRIEIGDPVVIVEDLGSRNGTFLNDQPLSGVPTRGRAELHDGDELRMANIRLRVAIDFGADEPIVVYAKT